VRELFLGCFLQLLRRGCARSCGAAAGVGSGSSSEPCISLWCHDGGGRRCQVLEPGSGLWAGLSSSMHERAPSREGTLSLACLGTWLTRTRYGQEKSFIPKLLNNPLQTESLLSPASAPSGAPTSLIILNLILFSRSSIWFLSTCTVRSVPGICASINDLCFFFEAVATLNHSFHTIFITHSTY